MKALVGITGGNGFIGRNLSNYMERTFQVEPVKIDHNDDDQVLQSKLSDCRVLFHLAGVNRPKESSEYFTGNREFTKRILAALSNVGNQRIKIIFSSSIQISKENDYGVSKKEAEDELEDFQNRFLNEIHIFRLPNVFGKWGMPNYNSAVATFCFNASRDIPLEINDPESALELVYIDDVVKSFCDLMPGNKAGLFFGKVEPVYKTTVGKVAEKIKSFEVLRKKLMTPGFNDDFTRKLYSTYVSYIDASSLSTELNLKEDNRGDLVEIIKNEGFGQIFVSTTKPGITRGNHYHHSKVEKFCVIKGEGTIRFRSLFSKEVISYNVSGIKPVILDIPPGYTHNITNTGSEDMITLFWANEIFNPDVPDTYSLEV